MVTRREVFQGAGAASIVAMTGMPAAARSVSRQFKSTLAGAHVGGQVVQVTRTKGGVLLQLRTELSANLVVLKYKYAHENSEFWKDGRIQSITSTTNDNGKRHYVKAKRTANGLEVDASRFSGVVSGNPATSSFILPQIMSRATWVSTQSGKPISVSTQKVGLENYRTGEGVVNCTKYACRGDLKIPIDAYFANGELAGYVAKARGLTVRTAAISMSPDFATLW